MKDTSISWLWFMIVVVVLMTARVVKSRSRNWKISIWFFVLGVTQNQERSPESNVDQEDHRAWLVLVTATDSGWILSNMSQEKVERAGIERFYLDLWAPIMTCHHVSLLTKLKWFLVHRHTSNSIAKSLSSVLHDIIHNIITREGWGGHVVGHTCCDDLISADNFYIWEKF